MMPLIPAFRPSGHIGEGGRRALLLGTRLWLSVAICVPLWPVNLAAEEPSQPPPSPPPANASLMFSEADVAAVAKAVAALERAQETGIAAEAAPGPADAPQKPKTPNI